MIYSVESSHEKESMLQIKYNIMSHYIEAFLNNRKQRVRIKGIFSNWVPVGSGIPQSSLLGPTLFIIYINDLVEHVNYGSDLYLYADDAKFFYLNLGGFSQASERFRQLDPVDGNLATYSVGHKNRSHSSEPITSSETNM